MNKRAFQLAAVVAIVGVGCVLYNMRPRRQDAVFTPVTPQFRPGSAVFQADLLADWSPPNGVRGLGQALAKQPGGKATQEVEGFVAAWSWAAQPHLAPLALGPGIELAARGPREQSRLDNALEVLRLMFLPPAAWDGLGPAAAVGTAAGPVGPLSALSSLVGEPQLHALVVEKNSSSGIVVWGSRTTNITIGNPTSRKTWTDRFTGGPAEADRALRTFRERLEERARQLGAELGDSAETVRDNSLEGFTFNYTLAPAHGRVEVRLEPGLARDYQLRVEVEETQE